MNKFLGYCFDENDRYDKAIEIENEGDAMHFLMHNLSKFEVYKYLENKITSIEEICGRAEAEKVILIRN